MINFNKYLIISEAHPQNIYDNYYKNVPKDIYDIIAKADKTATKDSKGEIDNLGKITRQVLDLWKKDKFDVKANNGELLRDIFHSFTEYNTYKSRLKGENEKYKNISNIKTVDDLLAAAHAIHVSKQAKASGSDIKQAEKDVEVVFEDDKWQVVIPLNHQASMKWGRKCGNAVWCVSSSSASAYFYQYVVSNDLYLFYNKEDANKSYALGFWGNGDVELNNNQNRRQRTDNFVKEYPELEPIMDEILDRWDNIKNNRDIYLKELQKRYMKYHSPYILMVMAGNEEGDDMLLETMKIYLDKTIMETPLYVSGDAENGKGHYTYLILLCLKHELFESFTYLVDFGAKLDVVDDFGNSVFTVFYDDELGDPNPKGDRNFQKVLKQPENQKMKENIESFKWEIVKKKIEKTAMNKDTKRDFSFSIDGDTVTMIGNDIRDLSLNFKIDQRYWAEKIFKGDFGSEIYDWEFRSDIESILKYYDFDNRTEPILEKIFDSLQPDYEYEDIKEALNDNEELRDALSDTIETAYRYAKETATQNLIENEFEDAIKTEGFEIIWGESKFKKVYNRIDNLNELFIILDKGFNMIFDEDGDDKMYEPFSVDEPRYGWDGDVNDKDFNEYLREKLQNDFYDILNPKEESVVNNEQMKEHFISFKRFITL